jgi:hypothetical protein
MTLRVRGKMPGEDDPPSRPAGWILPVAGIVPLTLWATVATLIYSAEPPGHIRYWLEEHGGTYAYPTHGVIVVLSVLYTEAIAAIALMRWRVRLPVWVRSGVLGGVLLPFVIVGMAGPMFDGIALWHGLTGLWLLGTAVILVVIRLVRYVRMRRAAGY